MSLRAGLIVTAVMLGASMSAAQTPDGPPPGGPVPVPLPTPPTAPPPRLLAPAPSNPLPGLPAPPVLGNAPAPVLVPRQDFVYWQDAPPQQPLPSWPFAQPPGWFVGLEASPTLPRVDLHEYHSHGRNLDWTVAPRFTLGYRFEHGGSLFVSYRNLTTQATVVDLNDSLAVRLRLNANWLDLTYLSRNYVLGPHLRWQWETGVRSAYLYNDLQVQGPDYVGTVRDTFGGAGPHAGVRVAWWFGDTGWSVFTRLDGAVLFGGTRENSSAFAQDGLGNVIPWAGSQTCHCGVVDGRAEVGVGYVVPTRPWLRFDAGFQTEVFSWQDLTFSDRGPFVRCVIGF